MKTLDVEMIKEFEGCYLTAYPCPAGVWTIGYGHTKNVVKGMVITQQEAETFLLQDLQTAEKCINRFAKYVTLSQNQFDALVSWVFNLGCGNFNKSTLKAKILNNSGREEVSAQWMRWVYAGGVKMNGLIARRKKELEKYYAAQKREIPESDQ